MPAPTGVALFLRARLGACILGEKQALSASEMEVLTRSSAFERVGWDPWLRLKNLVWLALVASRARPTSPTVEVFILGIL
jgi:hypothetical protein